LLAGPGRHDDLHGDLAQPGGEGVDAGQPGLAEAGKRPPEAEDDAFLVLRDDLEAEHAGRPIPRHIGLPGPPGPRTALTRLPAFEMPSVGFHYDTPAKLSRIAGGRIWVRYLARPFRQRRPRGHPQSGSPENPQNAA